MNNKFEEEIARINRERDEKLAGIDAQIHALEVINHDNKMRMTELRQLRRELFHEASHQVFEITKKMDAHYAIKGSGTKLGRILHGFFEAHPEVEQLWIEYTQRPVTEEGGDNV